MQLYQRRKKSEILFLENTKGKGREKGVWFGSTEVMFRMDLLIFLLSELCTIE
jgi:hypothetical protein